MPFAWSPNRRRFCLLCGIIAVVLASTAVGATNGATAATEPQDLRSDTGEDVPARIGETVTLSVETYRHGDAVLSVGEYSDDYSATLQLTDGNGDGRVVVELDTLVAASRNRTLGEAYTVRHDDDWLQFRESDEEDTGPVLEPGVYGLRFSSEGREGDYRRLLVRDRWPNGTVLSGPRGTFEDLRTSDDIATARRTGRLTPAKTVMEGSTLAVRVNSSALATAIQSANGSTTTAQFRSVLDRNGSRLFFRQTNPTTMLHPLYFLLHSDDRFRAINGSSPTTYYLLFETDVLSGKRCDGVTDCPGERSFELRGGERLAVNLTLAGDPIVRHVNRRAFEVIEREMRISPSEDADIIVAEPTTDQRISGRTTFEPGTNVTVTVASNDAAFTRTKRVTVAANQTTLDHRFVASFDFSSLDAGDLLTVTATVGNTSEQELVSVQTGNATVTLRGNGTENHSAAATLPSGGFVVVHAGSVDGPVLGTSQHVSAGFHPNVTIPIQERMVNGTRRAVLDSAVAVAYRDADSDGEFDETDLSQPYVRNQTTVRDENPMTPPSSSSAETPDSPTTTTTGDRNTEPTSNSQNQTAVTTTTGTGVGFAIPLTVAVLLGSISVIRRFE